METRALRQELHTLVDHIRSAEIGEVKAYLSARIEPIELALLAAPIDTEPMSEHERRAWDSDIARRERGEPPLAAEDFLNDLGFSDADLL